MIVQYLHAFFNPIWEMITTINVPGFLNVTFFDFYFCVLVVTIVCTFIGNIIGIGVRSDINHAISKRRGDQVTTISQTYSGNGELIKTTFTKSHR